MRTLSPGERRALRAKAHLLDPVVSIGQHGLTPAVLHEIDVNLVAHELIKIRVFGDDRDVRDALLARICEELDAAAVQHLGKVLIVWRPAPQEESPPPRRPPRTAAGAGARSAAQKAPQARRPRTPLPRTPARPAPASWRTKTPLSTPGRPAPRGGKAEHAVSKAAPETGSRRRSRGVVADDRGQERRFAAAPAGRRAVSVREGGKRPARGPPSSASGKLTAGRAGVPHGKSTSSTTGASGARRRRKART